ncbi:TMP-TENI-domain-containing protein [Xylona heveae TC161]|uniref:TMP-TENI-domain-containing protein n=1 Tax=Xylona heveae (strain CBS 132557 / TC161) TaxID=1328760 RepID=A0A165FYL9_XYLHT|nr:TMP-TENI-domain-containing protein [Xylona heveae TC161]KZF21538.1 TMP-TENI-domain-containing protein [Xylona heveae TC161]
MLVDYSLYLVTDSTPAILKGHNLVDVVEAALQGGVTIVQYRDKTSDTADLIKTAREIHEVTLRYQVPFLINDRVDVALAIGAEGVHVGQDDMDLATVRRLMGKNAIIGVTASSIEEARTAAKGGADYLGLGTLFATPTKENTKSIVGTAGIKEILASLSAMDEKVSTVGIGGVNASNAQRILYQSKAAFKGLDGLAVVSAIVGADDPKQAASDLRSLIGRPPAFASYGNKKVKDLKVLLPDVPNIAKKVAENQPLCHNMTNFVVQNFAANIALSIGASPIMSMNGAEAPDLAKLGGSLVINMGTVTPEGLNNYLQALRAYNGQGGPVLFDPVGAGATSQRRNAVKTLMAGGYFDVIKGNEGEITTVLGESVIQQRGVDSGASKLTGIEKAKMVKKLAARERNVVFMTGVTDYISDGDRTFAIKNGHEYLGYVTGTGCTLGTTVAAFLAVHREDKLLAALAGIVMYEIAAERAAARENVHGPGSFVPALLDELFCLQKQSFIGQNGWLAAAKVEEVNV